MQPVQSRSPLEPLAPALLGMILAHVLGGMVLWTLLPLWKPKLPPEVTPAPPQHWFSPGDFKLPPLPVAPPIAKASAPKTASPAPSAAPSPAPILPQPSGVMDQRQANKSITLSPVLPPDPSAKPEPVRVRPPTVTLLDVARLSAREKAHKEVTGGADMDPVLQALDSSLKDAWVAPPIQAVPASQRHVRMTVSIAKDGTLVDATLTKPSGAAALDESARLALKNVKKISTPLPSSFPKDRYTVEINFHIE